jgi:creatinine amidohydrolase
MHALLILLPLILAPAARSAEPCSTNDPGKCDVPSPKAAATQGQEIFLENMTWQEVRDALKNGSTRILIPTAGTEQNGPHVVLGKHHCVVRHTAEEIAYKIRKTLVAPVIDYAPEEPHMAYPGTISLSDDTFYDLLKDTVTSLKTHGFKNIYLLGDSYGNQPPQEELVEDLGEDFAEEGVRLASLHDYYAANGQVEWLMRKGYSAEEIGGHAGIRDTSEMLAACPEGVRREKTKDYTVGDDSGANGRATQASAAIGRKMLSLKVRAAVNEIKRRERVPTGGD